MSSASYSSAISLDKVSCLVIQIGSVANLRDCIFDIEHDILGDTKRDMSCLFMRDVKMTPQVYVPASNAEREERAQKVIALLTANGIDTSGIVAFDIGGWGAYDAFDFADYIERYLPYKIFQIGRTISQVVTTNENILFIPYDTDGF